MKLVQKILSHGLLIAFIVAAFFTYMNRVDLFPQWFAKPAPAPVSHAQAVAPAQPATASTGVPVQDAGGDTQTVVTGGETPTVAPVEEAAPETTAAEPEPVVAAVDTVAVVVPETAVAAGTVAVEPVSETPPGAVPEHADEQAVVTVAEQSDEVQQEPESGHDAPVFRPLTESAPPGPVDVASEMEPASQQPDADADADQAAAPGNANDEAAANNPSVVAPQAAVGQETAPASGYRQQLELARAYFWKRDIRTALQVYQSLAKAYPERAEVWGEMGNLYFSIRRKPDAMNAYAHAITLLTEQGDVARARALLNVMYRLDARRAGRLEMRLRQTGG